MKTVRVIAAKGRRVPIHSSVATAPGGRLLIVDDVTPFVLPLVGYVRRRMNVGDLIMAPGAAAPADVQTPALPGAAAEPEVKEAELEAGGPPAAFGDLPLIDSKPEPRIAEPKEAK